MKPLFSIIIPTLNEELFLPKLLKNLEKQQAKNFEVLVIDSNSVDKTVKEAAKFEKHLNIVIFRQEKRNVSIQRNYGAAQAKGEYLIFLDADSKINKFFIKKLERVILKKKALFYVPMIKTDSKDVDIQLAFEALNIAFQLSQNFGRAFALGGAMIFQKDYFHTIGGFDEKLLRGEDIEIAKRSLQWNVKIRFLPEIYVVYSIRRIKKEGRLKAYYKYLLTTIDYLLHGHTASIDIEYEMGGHLYQNMRKKNFINSNLNNLFKKAKQIFTELLR